MALRNAFEGLSTESGTQEGVGLLRRLVALLSSPRGYNKTTGRHQVTALVESGTVSSVTTVTTVTTVSNLTNFGAGRDAGQMVVNPVNRTSWALNHRSRIV